MAAASPVDQLKDMFRLGSRYQVEKIVVIVAYVAIVVGSLAWGLSPTTAENELGAVFGPEHIAELNREVYFLQNSSDDTWHDVRIVLDQRHLYAFDEMKPRGRVSLGPERFEYFYYIPRVWGQSDWERLAQKTKLPLSEKRSLDPQFVQIRAREGSLTLKITNKKSEKYSGLIPEDE